MQSLDNAISFKAKRKVFGQGVKLVTVQDQEKPNPTYIDIANKSAAWLAEKTGGSAVPANPGVNPSLTITAMTERAMSKIPVRS